MNNIRYFPVLILLFILSFALQGQVDSENATGRQAFEIEFPDIIIRGVEQDIVIRIRHEDDFLQYEGKTIDVYLNNERYGCTFSHGETALTYRFPAHEDLLVRIGDLRFTKPVNPIPLWLSIIPPLLAILFALLFREVYSALLSGVWIGSSIIYFYQGSGFFVAIFKGFLGVIDTYIIQSLNNSDHLSIILFTMVIAATVSVITMNGGMKGVVNSLSKYARGPRSGAFITWMLGVIIFFDDYANTLVVGNTMRPLADKLRISREKLAYIIDSTAAPVASIAFVTTWIGAELSYIQDGINNLGLDESAYGVFFGSLAYSFYPVFALVFILFITWKGVDFGPMLKAEARARQGLPSVEEAKNLPEEKYDDEVIIPRGVKPRLFNALIPVAVIVFGAVGGLLYTGWDAAIWNNEELSFFGKLSDTIGNSDSYLALVWASFGSLVVALGLSFSQGLLNLSQGMDAVVKGFKTMLPAVLIMTLAWSVALVTKHMHTADFISQILLDADVSPFLLPSITFIMAAMVSFATGSSWGTMAILYPLILPSGWLVTQQYGLDYDAGIAIFHNITAAVLTGSVLGDHCSPISDTTILSSLASSCPHIEHVRTQLPYALVAGFFSIALGSLPAAYGVPSYILFPLGLLGLFLTISLLGRKSETYRVG